MLPDGYTARPARPEDAAAVAAVVAKNQLADFGVVEVSEADVREDWAGVDMASDTMVIERAGDVRAQADLVVRPGQVSVYGNVHPDDVGGGLGAYLMAWGEARARAMAGAEAGARPTGTVVRHYAPSTNVRLVRLLEDRGYEFQRAVLWMECDLGDPAGGAAGASPATAARSLPTGLSLRTYRGESDEPAVYHAFEAGSLDMNGRVPNTLEQWLASVGSKDKDLFFLVESAGEDSASDAAGRTEHGTRVVGILIASLREPDAGGPTQGAATPGAQKPAPAPVGHVDSVRVVREWRRRGIGAVLLTTAFDALRARGAATVGLSVDATSPTGAPSLYLNAGMRVTRRYLVMEKTFGPLG